MTTQWSIEMKKCSQCVLEATDDASVEKQPCLYIEEAEDIFFVEIALCERHLMEALAVFRARQKKLDVNFSNAIKDLQIEGCAFVDEEGNERVVRIQEELD